MLLGIVKEIENSTRKVFIPLLVGKSKDGSFTADDSRCVLLSSIKLLKETSLIERIVPDNTEFTLTHSPDFSVPLLISNRLDLNLTQIYDMCVSKLEDGKLPKDLEERIETALAKSLDTYGDGKYIAREFIKAIKEVNKYLNSDKLDFLIKVKSTVFDFQRRIEVFSTIEKLNSALSNPFKSINPNDNQTLIQQTPSDKLFIELPIVPVGASKEVKQAEFSLFKDKVNHCTPYPSKNYESINYKEDRSITLAEQLLIEGDPAMTSVPIQENEVEFYNALCEWISYNSVNSITPVDNNSDPDIVIDPLTKDHLENMIRSLMLKHRAHNVHIPEIFEDDSDEDDNVGNDSETTLGVSTFRVRDSDVNLDLSETTLGINTILELNKYLHNAYTNLGYKVYAEAIVKLARWGNRKSQNLYLEGSNTVYDVNSFGEQSYYGHIDDYTVRTFDGAEYVAESFIYTNVSVGDFNNIGRLDTPIGVVLNKNLISKKDDTTLKLREFVPITDIISRLKSGELIHGITYENGKFSVSEKVYWSAVPKDRVYYKGLKDHYNQNSSLYLIDPMYRGEDLLATFMSLGSDNKQADGYNITIFSILETKLPNGNIQKELLANSFTDVNDLNKKVSSYIIRNKKLAIEYSIYGLLRPLIQYVIDKSTENNTIEPAELLNYWNEAIESKEFTGVQAIVKTNIKESNSFGSSEYKEREFGVNMIRKINPNGKLNAVRNVAGDQIIGVVETIKEDNGKGKVISKYILGGKSALDTVTLDPSAGKFSITTFLKAIISDAVSINEQNEKGVIILYNDIESPIELAKALQQ